MRNPAIEAAIKYSIEQTNHINIGWVAMNTNYNNSMVIREYLNQYYSDTYEYDAKNNNFIRKDANKKRKTKKKPEGISIESVIISQEKKDQIKAAIAQSDNHEKIFTKWGFDEVFEKGTAVSLLFWGIPGTGKTLMAQAIADHLKAKLKIIGVGDIQSSEPGGAERTITMMFETANKTNKETLKKDLPGTVLLFDECDSLLVDRNEVGPIIGGQVNTLLQQIEKYTGVVIFTTNRLGQLDPALERRLSAKIEFDFPDEEQRYLIWKRMIPKKAPLHKAVCLKTLSQFSLAGGNIKNAVLNAARTAAYKKSRHITMDHFIDAINKEKGALQSFMVEQKKYPHIVLTTKHTNNQTRTIERTSFTEKFSNFFKNL